MGKLRFPKPINMPSRYFRFQVNTPPPLKKKNHAPPPVPIIMGTPLNRGGGMGMQIFLRQIVLVYFLDVGPEKEANSVVFIRMRHLCSVSSHDRPILLHSLVS